jgi:thioredoxin 1
MAAPKFSELVSSDTPTLVDFSAEWCGPCRMLAPVLKQLKASMGDRVRILKIDIDRNAQLAAHFRVQSVPTLMIFRNGEMLWRQSGVMNAKQLEHAIDSVASQAA